MPIKKVVDRDDLRRRLDEVDEMSLGEELRLMVTGGLADRKAWQAAQHIALNKAKRQLKQAIKDEERRVRERQGLFWTSMEIEYFGHEPTAILPIKV